MSDIEVHFVLAQDNGKSKKFRLSNEEYVVIGRSKTLCQVFIDDKVCSSTHMKISIFNSAIYIEDLDSKNGVFINGVKVKKQRIYVDDKVRLGGSILFVNHSRMSEDSVQLATYQGTTTRGANLTLELDSDNHNRSASHSLRRIKSAFEGLAGRKKTIVLNKESAKKFITNTQIKNALLVDIFFVLIGFISLNVTFWKLYPESYTHLEKYGFFVVMFKGDAIKYSVASVIISIMLHVVNRNFPKGSLGERVVGIN